jgi:tryptophan 2,3-dioxygenase
LSRTNYADYLQLDVLLAAQKPLSEHPDELHFIIVHQVHELWFKLALHHMERACHAVQRDNLLDATRLIEQIIGIFANLRETVENLHTLPPMAFHRFRELLAPGSGMQSYQFREIEFLAGLRHEQHINWTKKQLAASEHWEHVHERLNDPSLYELFLDLVERSEVDDIAALYEHPSKNPELYLLADAMSALDHRVLAWRHSHIQLVERTIGAGVMGTGGTTHEYLQKTMLSPLFPELWEARNILTRRIGIG